MFIRLNIYINDSFNKSSLFVEYKNNLLNENSLFIK